MTLVRSGIVGCGSTPTDRLGRPNGEQCGDLGDVCGGRQLVRSGTALAPSGEGTTLSVGQQAQVGTQACAGGSRSASSTVDRPKRQRPIDGRVPTYERAVSWRAAERAVEQVGGRALASSACVSVSGMDLDGLPHGGDDGEAAAAIARQRTGRSSAESAHVVGGS